MSSNIVNLGIYLRVSTNDQDTNTSKKTQLDGINNYVKEHQITINKSYIYEDRYSASHKPKSSDIDGDNPFTRRGLNELIADAKLGKLDAVAVYTHDRLTRNVEESLILKFFFKKLNIKLYYCKPGEKLNTESQN